MEDSLIAIAFNMGIVAALVQLVKTQIVPKLKETAPWALTLIASAIGFAASFVLARTGIDISPIAGAFTGMVTAGLFSVVRNLTR